MRIPASVERVPENTADDVNRRIGEVGEAWVSHAAIHPEMIPRRLEALDREWDIERVLEANAAALCVMGVAMGVLSGKKWFVLPGIVGAFLFQHAIEGWCPPLPVLRRMGFRTRAEIDEEKFALKVLRGDFRAIQRRQEGEAGRSAAGRGEADERGEGSEAAQGRSEEGGHKRQSGGGKGKRKGEEGR